MTGQSDEWVVRRAEPSDLPGAHVLIWRVLAEDLRVSYNPAWHWDLDDLHGTYVSNPHHALFVAAETASGRIVGTTGVRAGGPASPPHPVWLAERYARQSTAQIVRAYVDRTFRRRGIARALTTAARAFVAQDGSYDVLYLHTDVRVLGAEQFWRSMQTREVYDARTGLRAEPTLHFELAFGSSGSGT
ncbi:MAG TPA: GNAT family N-acetyltransferase [Chloroflexaceae bacterium]|nr:GNAT family N-acetyltransferase [Chloroflexaceae bacterium]